MNSELILVDIYGALMFLSAMCLTVYICLALTVMFPLLESIPDFAALEAYRNLAIRWGGFELFTFNLGDNYLIFLLDIFSFVLTNLSLLCRYPSSFIGIIVSLQGFI